jgi:hypothetical protein
MSGSTRGLASPPGRQDDPLPRRVARTRAPRPGEVAAARRWLRRFQVVSAALAAVIIAAICIPVVSTIHERDACEARVATATAAALRGDLTRVRAMYDGRTIEHLDEAGAKQPDKRVQVLELNDGVVMVEEGKVTVQAVCVPGAWNAEGLKWPPARTPEGG